MSSKRSLAARMKGLGILPSPSEAAPSAQPTERPSAEVAPPVAPARPALSRRAITPEPAGAQVTAPAAPAAFMGRAVRPAAPAATALPAWERPGRILAAEERDAPRCVGDAPETGLSVQASSKELELDPHGPRSGPKQRAAGPPSPLEKRMRRLGLLKSFGSSTAANDAATSAAAGSTLTVASAGSAEAPAQEAPLGPLAPAPPEWLSEPQAAAFAEDLAHLTRTPALREIPPEQWMAFDTETTGLGSGVGVHVFLFGGSLPFAEEAQARTPWLHLLEGPECEEAWLLALEERLAQAGALLSFNGKSFDWPRLQDRARYVLGRELVGPVVHADLYHAVLRLFGRGFGPARLGACERRLLGRAREGDLPGAECPEQWFASLRGEGHRMDEVLRHNEEDVISLGDLAWTLVQGCRQAPQTQGATGEELSALWRRAGLVAASLALRPSAVRRSSPRLPAGFSSRIGDDSGGASSVRECRGRTRRASPSPPSAAATARLGLHTRNWLAQGAPLGPSLALRLAAHLRHADEPGLAMELLAREDERTAGPPDRRLHLLRSRIAELAFGDRERALAILEAAHTTQPDARTPAFEGTWTRRYGRLQRLQACEPLPPKSANEHSS